jgi:hypothetical protein
MAFRILLLQYRKIGHCLTDIWIISSAVARNKNTTFYYILMYVLTQFKELSNPGNDLEETWLKNLIWRVYIKVVEITLKPICIGDWNQNLFWWCNQYCKEKSNLRKNTSCKEHFKIYISQQKKKKNISSFDLNFSFDNHLTVCFCSKI